MEYITPFQLKLIRIRRENTPKTEFSRISVFKLRIPGVWENFLFDIILNACALFFVIFCSI